MAGERQRPLPFPPRGLTREMSADYCTITPVTWDRWVSSGLMPKPIPGTHRWDKKAIDRALDKLSGLDSRPAEADDADVEEWGRANGFVNAG